MNFDKEIKNILNNAGVKLNESYELSKEYPNHIQFSNDKESRGYPRKIYDNLESAKKSYEMRKEGIRKAEEENKRSTPLRNFLVIAKNPLGDGFVIVPQKIAQDNGLVEVYPVDHTSDN